MFTDAYAGAPVCAPSRCTLVCIITSTITHSHSEHAIPGTLKCSYFLCGHQIPIRPLRLSKASRRYFCISGKLILLLLKYKSMPNFMFYLLIMDLMAQSPYNRRKVSQTITGVNWW